MPIPRVDTFFSQRPWLISVILLAAISWWLGMGMLKAEDNPQAPDVGEQPIPLAKVQYQTFEAQSIAKTIELYGRTAPDKQANLGAEVAGKIVALLVDKGSSVKAGDPIAQIDKADLEIQLESVRANLNVKQKEFKAATSLKKKGLQGEVAYSSAQAALVEARSAVKNAQLALKQSVIKAPFDGIVDDLMIEIGDFVGVGDPVAKVISLAVLVIEADVSERHVQSLRVNQKASVRFADNQVVKGNLRYISRTSSPATNTFPIEIAIDNASQVIPAGVSAEVSLCLDTQQAIKISPAMLALSEGGDLGVKILVDEQIEFVPIQLVKAEQDGVWLSGLGERADIITLGQGFVRDGDSVIAVKLDPTNQ